VSYLMIDVRCKQCDRVDEVLIHRDEVGPWECPDCKTFTCERQLSAPAIRTSDSVSFRDGYKRPGWDRLKREAALDTEIARASTPSERKDLERERQKLTTSKD
jgi:hypothetical protein